MVGIAEELAARLPADRIQADPDVVGAYSQDRAVFEQAGTAAILVSPQTTAEVVAAVEAANAADVPIVPRGAGTGLTGAANASDGCLMVSLHRMNSILEIDTTNRMARVQPGVINSDLKAAVAEHGLFYPPDPASVDMSSIGGNVATNAGGLCCVKYGVTRDFVIGLEVVLADGRVMNTGRDTLKDTTGLDLTGLFVGSEGMLGIITEITLKLVPAPPPPATAVAVFDKLEPAGAAIVEVFNAGIEPSLMEVLNRTAIQAVEDAYKMDLDTSAEVTMLVQTAGVGSSEAIAEIAEICKRHGASFVHHIDDPNEGDMLIEVRRRVWPALERTGKSLLPEDVAVRRERLPELMAGISEIGDRHGIPLPTVGHAGDGNMHPILMFDQNNPDEVERAKTAFDEMVRLSLALGGTIAGEHGVGTLKRKYVEDQLDPIQLDVQRQVRTLFDPHGRFNPGKAL